jgi:hypothetical protein
MIQAAVKWRGTNANKLAVSRITGPDPVWYCEAQALRFVASMENPSP